MPSTSSTSGPKRKNKQPTRLDPPPPKEPYVPKPNRKEFMYTDVPPLPTAPQLDPFAYTPAEWKAHCWNLSPPICPECGSVFRRRQITNKETSTQRSAKWFCRPMCKTRWTRRLTRRFLPLSYRQKDWPGKAEGKSPPELEQAHEIWSSERDGGTRRLVEKCTATCTSYPTNSFPLQADLRGKPCGMPAGWGTDHNGIGRCAHHGGNHPRHKQAAQKQLVIRELREASMIFGESIEITPEEAILQELYRTNGAVEWYRQKIEALASESTEATKSTSTDVDPALAQWTKMGITPSVWVQLYNEERDRLSQIAKTAAGMGIEERKIRVVEEQGKMLAFVIQQFIQHPKMSFTPQQTIDARDVIRELLTTIDLPTTPAIPAEGRVVLADGLTQDAHDFIDAHSEEA